MTEAQKRDAMTSIAQRAKIAEASGLPATAKSWRDLHMNIGCRPAAEIILAGRPGAEATPER